MRRHRRGAGASRNKRAVIVVAERVRRERATQEA